MKRCCSDFIIAGEIFSCKISAFPIDSLPPICYIELTTTDVV